MCVHVYVFRCVNMCVCVQYVCVHVCVCSAITITKLLGVGNKLKTKQNPPNLMPNSSGQRSVPKMGFLLC